MDITLQDAPRAPSRARLWTEFVALFIGVPILMVIYFAEIQERRLLFGIVTLLALVAFYLLWRTPGWSFANLWKGPVLSEWRLILGFWAVSALTSCAFVFAIDPEMFLAFPKAVPLFWLFVMIAYPILSAWPQEVIYRSLFFERYESLFPGQTWLIVANGLVFGFGHLFYWNWITIAMTAVGGAIMGWAYLRHRSMALAWVLHALAGQIVFTVGLGQYFYSGNVPTG